MDINNSKAMKIWKTCLLLTLIVTCGCQQVPQFPNRPMRVQIASDGSKILAFDTNRDRRADYWQIENFNGRKVELQFADGQGNGGQTVELDTVKGSDVPHFIIALDGVPFQLVKELYDQECFRLFYEPSRVVSCFPGMTDLAFQQIFGGKKAVAYQAKHFDREDNLLHSGNDIYLSGEAATWADKLDYRLSFQWDPLAYTFPEAVFEHELEEMMNVFNETQGGTKIVYSVGTAGLGTRGGRKAILKYLRTIDRFCEQIVYERRGRVKITLLADHGHNMSGRGRIDFEKLLQEEGYRLGEQLGKPRDVVTVQYGLVTYAAFFTDDPGGVAEVLLQEPATTIACYRQGETVVVQSLAGKAVIKHRGNKYSYVMEYGDPLELEDIIEQLRREKKVDSESFIDDRAMFEATIKHIYPDPLKRIWEAFDGLVAKPADLIVCLKDGWVHGSKFFHAIIGGATSTHGGLNQINSMTFAMSMWGPLPDAMRLDEVMPALKAVEQEAQER